MIERKEYRFTPENLDSFISKTLYWAEQHNHYHYFKPNDINIIYGTFPHMICIGAHKTFNQDYESFEALKTFNKNNQDWNIGYFSYDLKNQTEALSSSNPDKLKFPEIYFYCPKHIISIAKDSITISSTEDPLEIYQSIKNHIIDYPESNQEYSISSNTNQDQYCKIVEQIKQDIINGDYCELNYCISQEIENLRLDPIKTFQKLTKESPMPFAVLQKINQHYLLSTSPERFLKKEGRRLISQPMKGTAKRGKDEEEDKHMKESLLKSEKERAENMMIVDLVRNDLNKSCKTGTVRVEELFKINSYTKLHQMVSTITGTINPDTHFIDAIKNAYPMGSMTGAPKIKTMERIEKYETHKRSIFSGAVGYITPDGNFDFNVVIRSLLYNKETKQGAVLAGSAITFDSIAKDEYQECILKSKSLLSL